MCTVCPLEVRRALILLLFNQQLAAIVTQTEKLNGDNDFKKKKTDVSCIQLMNQ